jgi:putative nucleotidyltransferase with HDIG domain
VYAWVVAALGLIPITHSLYSLTQGTVPTEWLLFTGLTLFTGFFAISVPSLHATISASETFVFVSALLFGPAAATVTVMLDGVIVAMRSRDRRPYRVAFNIAEPTISVWAAAHIFYAISGTEPMLGHSIDLLSIALPLILLAAIYFALNTMLTAKAIELDKGLAFREFIRTNSTHTGLNFGASLFLLFLIAANAERVMFAAIGIVLPLLALSYYTSRVTMDSIEERNQHLSDLNTLYLSSVEALAMAIDAKDQVTHGHINRVQEAVVAVAARLGIDDPRELMTLRAGALLHDLGKIGVPEHILNKPGPLTSSEFEIMKTHAAIGADIVAQVDFPYPIEPIIRHHHENWDGQGYPEGLSGEDIPLACRILAVVDCYDALRSDRPYRRRLNDHEAMDIIQGRRGTMYDPEVVDEFTAIRTQIRFGESAGTDTPRPPLTSRVRPVSTERPTVRLQSATATEATAFPAWRRAVAPDAGAVLNAVDPRRNVLNATRVSHSEFTWLRDLEIPLGTRVTGWVGANRKTITNADARLDLSDSANAGHFENCLSVPITDGPELCGVLSLYSASPRAFSEEQSRVIESMAHLLIPRVGNVTSNPIPDAEAATPVSRPLEPRDTGQNRQTLQPLTQE